MSKELIIDFLNDLLAGERVIRDLTFLNNEQLPEYREGKAIVYDIYCLTNTGERIIVEMQSSPQAFFVDRALFYMSRAIVNQGSRGDDGRYEIKAVYVVALLNFEIKENRN